MVNRNILFICTGNSARSQMAEAFCRKHGADVFTAFSAGTHPEAEIFPVVVTVMKEVGIDLSGHYPKSVREFLGKKHFEQVIIVCADAEKECPVIFGSARRVFLPFDDPRSIQGNETDILDGSRRIRDAIECAVCRIIREA
ncbi:arsenate reductase ArsC [bacterium]|nr:arsenate reductase ArsC [candidate division CSSED10-310 bacterium]